jgi:hypothetical protein
MLADVSERIDKQEIITNVTLPVVIPLTRKRVIQPLSRERAIIGNKQRHGLSQPVHIVPARARQALPVLEKCFGLI